MSDDTKTPEEWCELLGVRILDPDGWRQDSKSLTDPITRQEFESRLVTSTAQRKKES